MRGNTIRCGRCGNCCYYLYEGKIKKCKYLIKFDNGRTVCRVYDRRVGTRIDKHPDGRPIICIRREYSPFNYEGCPYNVEGKPFFDHKTGKVTEAKNVMKCNYDVQVGVANYDGEINKEVNNMPRKNGTGPRSGSKGPRDGRGQGSGRASGSGAGKKTGGRKGNC